MAGEGDTPTDEVRPARGYSWPPFQPGHELSLKHGAYSPARYQPRAREVEAQLRATVTWWTPADAPTIGAYCTALAQVELLEAYLADLGGSAGGLVDAEGEVRSAATFLLRCQARVDSLGSKLGMDPLSRARLGRDVAAGQVDMAKLMAEAAAREAHGG